MSSNQLISAIDFAAYTCDNASGGNFITLVDDVRVKTFDPPPHGHSDWKTDNTAQPGLLSGTFSTCSKIPDNIVALCKKHATVFPRIICGDSTTSCYQYQMQPVM